MLKIVVKGAKEHNLNVSLEIQEKLVVITGLSGSGKSSLALTQFMLKTKKIRRKSIVIRKTIFR